MPKSNFFPPLVLNVAGFSFAQANGTSLQVNWGAINSVKAYKLDLLTTDEVRLVIALQSLPEGVIVISEEQSGFNDVVAEMERRLNFPTGWWDAVVRPPFETNETLVYSGT